MRCISDKFTLFFKRFLCRLCDPTVGYLSIDMLILEIKLCSGTEQEKKYANNIKKVINDHHWILVTLLLCNAFACEAMPIFIR